MTNFSGLLTSIIISLTSVPLVVLVTHDDGLSKPFAMMAVGFGILLIITIMLKFLLVPLDNVGFNNLEKRGLLYYTCCLFMWTCIADLTLQSQHFELFGIKSNTKYFQNGELYLATPFGITTQFWNAIVHFIFYMVIIFQIDNCIDCRSATLYWCGSIMTSQFVVMIGNFTGRFSDKLEYSSWINSIFVVMPIIFFSKFIIKPFNIEKKYQSFQSPAMFDYTLCLMFILISLFNLFRGLGALGSNYPLIKYYIDNFEPYIKDPSYFGRTWVLYAAVYGIPMQFVAIYGLLKPGCSWMLNLSVYYAAGMLQGTFTYLSYSWYPSSEPEYRIPKRAFPTVCLINVLFVIIAHMLLFRCITNQKFFVSNSYQPLKSINSKKIL